MKIRRMIAALGLTVVTTAGTMLATSSPASATAPVYVSINDLCNTDDFQMWAADSQGIYRGTVTISVDCSTLAGNINLYSIVAYVDDLWNDGYTTRLETVIDGGSPQYVWVSQGGYEWFSTSQSGKSGYMSIYAYVP